MSNGLMNEGLMLMLVGMGTVFVFLTILVATMTLMSRIVMRCQPDALPHGDTDDEVAAIVAAITAHRRKQ